MFYHRLDFVDVSAASVFLFIADNDDFFAAASECDVK